jgi:predicted house-cleaning noncanonical NTP pyrophosphatase (MazG superfamily)
MSMSEVYQPAIILHLLEQDGVASKQQLARVLSGYDDSVQEYYQRILMRWPKQTLTKHDIVKYDRKGRSFVLRFELEPEELVEKAKTICENKIEEWIRKRANSDGSAVDASKRYRILKAARGKCELCGISAKISPIDIDHIIPRNKADRHGYIVKDGIRMHVDDERNLQALCLRCNRAKRDQDTTDFRLSERKLVRDRIPDIIRQSGRTPVTQQITDSKLKERLLDKLIEEHAELLDDTSVGEIVDMIEVLLALSELLGHTETETMELLHAKRLERGGFSQGIFLVDVLPHP